MITPRDCMKCKHEYYEPCDGKDPKCPNVKPAEAKAKAEAAAKSKET